MTNTKNAIITYISETTYEDNTFWVNYEIGDRLGYEIVDGDKVKSYKVGGEIIVKDKVDINVCSETLQTLIDNCGSSDNEMLFVEFDEIEEDEVFKIQDEVIELDNKYENLKLSECITFGEDGCAITVYGGVSTKFIF